MHSYRKLQRYSVLTLLGIPGSMFVDVTPVRVVSLWILGLLAFAASQFYRVHYRNMAAELHSTDHAR
jgi:hypothetical protein